MLPNVFHYEHATGAEIRRAPVDLDVLILPAAAPEHHGPHLPLGTDSILSENVAWRVAAHLAEAYPDRRIWVHPTWALGAATIRGVGSAKVPVRLFRRTVRAYLRRFVRQGWRHFVLLTAHGAVPHTGALDAACASLRRMGRPGRPIHAVAPSARIGGRVFFGDYADDVRQAGVPLPDDEVRDLAWDLHAGRLETAMMLAAAPSLVDAGWRELAPLAPPRRGWLTKVEAALGWGVERLGRSDEERRDIRRAVAAGAADLSWILRGREEGYLGRPNLATAAEGEALLAAVSRDIAAAVREVFDGRRDAKSLESAAILFYGALIAIGLVAAALALAVARLL